MVAAARIQAEAYASMGEAIGAGLAARNKKQKAEDLATAEGELRDLVIGDSGFDVLTSSPFEETTDEGIKSFAAGMSIVKGGSPEANHAAAVVGIRERNPGLSAAEVNRRASEFTGEVVQKLARPETRAAFYELSARVDALGGDSTTIADAYGRGTSFFIDHAAMQLALEERGAIAIGYTAAPEDAVERAGAGTPRTFEFPDYSAPGGAPPIASDTGAGAGVTPATTTGEPAPNTLEEVFSALALIEGGASDNEVALAQGLNPHLDVYAAFNRQALEEAKARETGTQLAQQAFYGPDEEHNFKMAEQGARGAVEGKTKGEEDTAERRAVIKHTNTLEEKLADAAADVAVDDRYGDQLDAIAVRQATDQAKVREDVAKRAEVREGESKTAAQERVAGATTNAITTVKGDVDGIAKTPLKDSEPMLLLEQKLSATRAKVQAMPDSEHKTTLLAQLDGVEKNLQDPKHLGIRVYDPAGTTRTTAVNALIAEGVDVQKAIDLVDGEYTLNGAYASFESGAASVAEFFDKQIDAIDDSYRSHASAGGSVIRTAEERTSEAVARIQGYLSTPDGKAEGKELAQDAIRRDSGLVTLMGTHMVTNMEDVEVTYERLTGTPVLRYTGGITSGKDAIQAALNGYASANHDKLLSTALNALSGKLGLGDIPAAAARDVMMETAKDYFTMMMGGNVDPPYLAQAPRRRRIQAQQVSMVANATQASLNNLRA